MNPAPKFKRVVLVAASVSLLLAGGCTAANQRDLEGVNPREPDKAESYTNINEHPNIVRLCIDGVAIMTTTRQYGDSVTRVPEWDAWCAKH
jgi:hypothetical protein